MTSDILTPDEFSSYLKKNRWIARYDPNTEKRIAHPWWNVNREKIDEGLKELGLLVAKEIRDVPKDDLELQHILRSAESLRQVPRGVPKKLALLGPQGAGKSLLINALFHQDGLSLTGADGQACTSVPIKYVFGPSDTSDPQYSAEVKFFGAKELEKMIEGHARSFFHVYHADEDTDDEDSPRTRSLGQDELDRRMKDTAEEVFHTLFGGKEQFLQYWSTNSYRSGDFARICQAKCQQAMEALNVDSKLVLMSVAKEPKDLLKKVKRFMAKVEDQTSLWPLVDHISIRFQDALLEQNLEIWDLPGWGDTNADRARHADEIKDTVDLEIIVADTIRISTDDLVINNARSAALNHSLAQVKLVATKIDAISDNQLAQCTGPGYDELKDLIQKADERAMTAEEEDDTATCDMYAKYKTYLERKLKQQKVNERANNISKELRQKLKGRGSDDAIECFHVSAADYMKWMKKEKLMFRDQPALSPEETGIPSLRQYLARLPADDNLDNYKGHVFFNVPYFIKKIRRVVKDSDRDVGFRNLADGFDKLRLESLPILLDHSKEGFRMCTKSSIGKMQAASRNCKIQVDKTVLEWMELKAPALNRVLKSKGVILPGTSRAKGLERGCDWNETLASILTPCARDWYKAQLHELKGMTVTLIDMFKQFDARVVSMMDMSEAGVGTIETAKNKYRPYQPTIRAKVCGLMHDVQMKLEHLLRRATMEDGRQNSLIANITEPIFDEVFKAVPDFKTTANGKKKKYVMPMTRFKKEKLKELFSGPANHFVDQFIKQFQEIVNSSMNELLEEKFSGINKYLDEFTQVLRSRAPIPYQVTVVGKDIRANLEALLPRLEELTTELQQWFPAEVRDVPDDQSGACETSTLSANIGSLFEKASKRKAAPEPAFMIKQEPGAKKTRFA